MEHVRTLQKELVRTMRANNGLFNLTTGDTDFTTIRDALDRLAECCRVEQINQTENAITYRLIPTEAEVKKLFHDQEVLFEHHGDELAGKIIDICSKRARILFYNTRGEADLALVPFNKIKT